MRPAVSTPRSFLPPLAAALLATLGRAQAPLLNELYVSQSGFDEHEFVELIGVPGTSLNGFCVCVVEGDAPVAGTLDRVWDLAGHAIGGNGYFTLGTPLVPGVDLVAGNSNLIENGTETVYLIESSNVPAIAALLGTDVSNGPDTTVLPSLGVVRDLVAIVDDDFTLFAGGDVVFDDAIWLGADGPFLPAGVYRGDDGPNPWCGASFLDFDWVANADQPRTPDAANGPCVPETVLFAGLDHTSLGVAGMYEAGGLLVSNIGSSGLDGVRIDLGEHVGYVRLRQEPLPGAAGGPHELRVFGALGGVPGQLLGMAKRTPLGGQQVSFEPDFTPLGALTHTVELSLAGTVVFAQSGLSGASSAAGPAFQETVLHRGGAAGLGLTLASVAGPAPVVIAGGPTVPADTIRLVPDGATPVPDYLEALVLVELDGTGFELLDEALGLFGNEHRARGGARLSSLGGQLTLSNIGATGDDGVAIDLGIEHEDIGFRVELEPLDLGATAGGELAFEATGSVGGSPGTALGAMRVLENGGALDVKADFAAVGATLVQVTGMLGGVYQGTVIVPAGVVATLLPGPTAELRVKELGVGERDFSDWFVVLDPGLVAAAGGGSPLFTADLLRLRAHDPTLSVESLTGLELTARDTPPVVIRYEGDHTRFEGFRHETRGAARLGWSGELVLQNIGATGDDGVAIELTEVVEAFSMGVRPDQGLPGSARMDASMIGSLEGGPEQGLGTLRGTVLAGATSTTELWPDFAALGHATYDLRIFDAGQLVFSEDGRAGAACVIPTPLEHRLQLGATGLGPEMTVELPAAVPILVYGGPTILGDRVEFAPPENTTEQMVLVRAVLRGTDPRSGVDLPFLVLFDERVHRFGNLHAALGGTDLSGSAGLYPPLTLSNIGATGEDGDGVGVEPPPGSSGLDLELDDSSGAPIELGALPGARLVLAATGTVAGSPGASLGKATLESASSGVQVSADFSSLGSNTVEVAVYEAGVLAGSAIVPGDGLVATVAPQAGGTLVVNGCGQEAPQGRDPYLKYRLCAVADVTPAGHTTLSGDEIRLIAKGATSSVDSLERLEVRAAGFPALGITDELVLEASCLGARYCVAAPNSVGSGARICASGSRRVAEADLTLSAGPVPDQFGLFYFGPNQVRIPFGHGFRCVGGSAWRLPIELASNGALAHQVDFARAPASTQLTPGSTWNFQMWYRDPDEGPPGFNLSDATSITFTQ